jgi:hypothetical protein
MARITTTKTGCDICVQYIEEDEGGGSLKLSGVVESSPPRRVRIELPDLCRPCVEALEVAIQGVIDAHKP